MCDCDVEASPCPASVITFLRNPAETGLLRSVRESVSACQCKSLAVTLRMCALTYKTRERAVNPWEEALNYDECRLLGCYAV
jgi:hypothetical protein